MTLEEINSERKSLNEQLKSLKTQRDAKVLALQQRKEMFNSDKFLASLYKVDPSAASFFADKQVKQRQLDISADKSKTQTYTVYTPEQKQILDKKEANRQLWQRAIATKNVALSNKDQTTFNQASADVTKYAAEDARLSNLLESLGVSGYKPTEIVQTDPYPVNGASGASGDVVKTKFETAKEIVENALDINNGYTTADKKAKAKSDMLQYNAGLGNFGLTTEEKTSLENLIETAKVPGKIETDEEIAERIWKSLDNNSQKLYALNAVYFIAGISKLKEGVPGAAIGNFIKSENPTEAVNSDDITNAGKGMYSDTIMTAMKAVGWQSGNDNVYPIAVKLGRSARSTVERVLNSIKAYIPTNLDEKKKDNIFNIIKKRHLLDVTPVFNFSEDGTSTAPPAAGGGVNTGKTLTNAEKLAAAQAKRKQIEADKAGKK